VNFVCVKYFSVDSGWKYPPEPEPISKTSNDLGIREISHVIKGQKNRIFD